jgi:ornithine carbamoyltransferase
MKPEYGREVCRQDRNDTDVWVSMGEEKEREKRLRDFTGYQINGELLDKAGSAALVMHGVPAHRGLETTDDMIEGPRSLVWVQGENKLYGAAAILDAAGRLEE